MDLSLVDSVHAKNPLKSFRNIWRNTSQLFKMSFVLRQTSFCHANISNVKFLHLKMTHSSDDPRKKFLLDTAGNLYGLRPAASLTDSPELNNFLDDANEFLLSVSANDNDLHFSNKVMQMFEC